MSDSICEECGLPFVICHTKGTVTWALKYRDKAEVAAHILPLLATPVPDLVEAGKVLEGVTPGPWHVGQGDKVPFVGGGGFARADLIGPESDRLANARFIAWCREGVPALIALATAQAAQIAGLNACIEQLQGPLTVAALTARAEAAEAKVAELEAQVVAEKEENRWAYIQAAMDDKQTDAETEAATLRAEVERLRGALDQITWSNDSKWQADCARAALEGKA